MFLEYIKTFHIQDIINILSEKDNIACYCVKIHFLNFYDTYPEFGDKILCSPGSTLPSCDKDLIKLQQDILEKNEYKCLISNLPSTCLKRNVFTRFYGLPFLPIRYCSIIPRNEDLGYFIKVTGTVVRVTQGKILEYQRLYVCKKCQFENHVVGDFEHRYVLRAPRKCLNTKMRCRSSKFTEVNLSTSDYCKDYQQIKIQEPLNKLIVGAVPGYLLIIVENDLVGICKPGDKVIISGEVCRRWCPPKKGRRSQVDLVLQGNCIEVTNARKILTMTPEVKESFDEFWMKYQHCPLKGRDQIVYSVCPKVYGLHLVKLAILLTVITASNHVVAGYQNVTVSDEESTRHIRDQSHLLLVGDPGTGKSQLLQCISELTPRWVFATGPGSTRAGLTCAALRIRGEWQLQAGALALADRGVCCIDEIAHLREHDRSAIHEAMEQQTISVAKAGIVCKLNSRCSVVAACNPKKRYQRDRPLSDNVSLGIPLLSRFDLIFILLDSKNKSWDKLLSTYILYGPNKEEEKRKWTTEKVQMYIGYVGPIESEITDSASTILKKYYLMQRWSEPRDRSRTTIRMLNSLIRLSQAHCRLMYRNTILTMDAIVAVSLVDLSMQDCAIRDTDALHSNFQKYPDYEYLCTAKKLLTRMNLLQIWKEELLYYANLLQVDHKTLESDIENGNTRAFAKYDNIIYDNIPQSSSIVTSSNLNKSSDKKVDKTGNGDEGKSNEVTNERATTSKKHSSSGNIKKQPVVIKKKKRKDVTIDANVIGNKIQTVKNKKSKKLQDDNSSESSGCDETDLLNDVPSVNDVLTQLGVTFKYNSDSDSESGGELNEDTSNKAVVISDSDSSDSGGELNEDTKNKAVLSSDSDSDSGGELNKDTSNKTVFSSDSDSDSGEKLNKDTTNKTVFNSDSESDSGGELNKDTSNKAILGKKISNDLSSSDKNNYVKSSSNKTIDKLKQFECNTKSDLNKFYNEKSEKNRSLEEDKTVKLLDEEEEEEALDNWSQLSIFDSCCYKDLDL